jgi:hypothetical protein
LKESSATAVRSFPAVSRDFRKLKFWLTFPALEIVLPGIIA